MVINLKLGKRLVQKLKSSRVVTLPVMWLRQFGEPDGIKEVEFFMDGERNLIIKAPEGR